MPRFDQEQTMPQAVTAGASHFVFSGVRPEKLTSTEYTLVTIVVDETGSVISFRDSLLKMLQAAVGSCLMSPRVDNLLVRATAFNTSIREIFGFTLVRDIDIPNLQPLDPAGSTALIDAGVEAVAATKAYAETLVAKGLNTNAIVFVVTDGEENASNGTFGDVRNQIEEVKKSESVEQLLAILIGIEANPRVKTLLAKFRKSEMFDAYIDAGSANEKNMAQLARFISDSISSHSQVLGSGGVSQPLSYPNP